MDESTAPQPDMTGCLLKIVLFALGFGLLLIFLLGALAGMVIASGL
jgi:hypothetical protein